MILWNVKFFLKNSAEYNTCMTWSNFTRWINSVLSAREISLQRLKTAGFKIYSLRQSTNNRTPHFPNQNAECQEWTDIFYNRNGSKSKKGENWQNDKEVSIRNNYSHRKSSKWHANTWGKLTESSQCPDEWK